MNHERIRPTCNRGSVANGLRAGEDALCVVADPKPGSRVGLLALLVMLLWVAAPQPLRAGESGRQTMREIFDLSGLGRQLGSVADQVVEEFTQHRARVPGEGYAAVRRVLRREFESDSLQSDVFERLEKRYDARLAVPALEWLRSPLGRRITALEVRAESPEGLEGMQEFAARLATAPPDRTRLVLIQQLDEAAGVTHFAVEVALAMSSSVAMAVNATLPSEHRTPEAEIRKAVESQRLPISGMMKEAATLSSLYTYAELSDEELASYAAFAASEAGTWYNRGIQQALLDVLSERARRVGSAVARIFREGALAAPAP